MALRLRRRGLWWAGIVVLIACQSGAHGADKNAEQVKAAIIHKIAKFVAWPEAAFDSPRAPIRFCVVQGNAMFDAMQSLQERPIHGRKLIVRAAPPPAETPTLCDILYLGPINTAQAGEWLAHVADSPILTVSESSKLRSQQSVVTIIVRRKKVRFAINIEASSQAGLSIDAQLLQLAAAVNGRRG